MFHKISTFFLACLILTAISGVQKATAGAEENKALVHRFIEEILNQQNLGAVDAVFTPDFVFHDPGFPGVDSAEAFKQTLTSVFTGFPDGHFSIDDMILEGDKAAIRYRAIATQLGEFGGIPPTGKRVNVTAMFIFHFAGGKIKEGWQVFDGLGLLHQLGVVPPPVSPGGVLDKPIEVTGDPGTPEANKAFVYRWVENFWNHRNAATAGDFFAPDYVRHDPGFRVSFYAVPEGMIFGLETFKQWVAQVFAGVPDFHATVEDVIAEGDRVVGRYTLRGTFAPTGLPFEIAAMNVLRIRDGLIVQEWLNVDNLGWEGQIGLFPPPQPPEETTEDFSHAFFMSLSQGLNLISLPLKPKAALNARSFAKEIGATVVITLDEKRQRFVGFTLDAPDDGFPIEGGAGYIVNMPQAREVAFVGAAWTNQPAVKAAPASAADTLNGRWAFVVSGRFEVEQAASLFYVTVRNTRTSTVAVDVIRSGYFAAAFADLTRKSVVEAGDRLEVTVSHPSGEIVSGPFEVTVTPEALRQAFLSTPLKRVEKPNQSLLLQNYPNPFNPETWMPYQLREAASVVIRIYDTQGSLVRTLDLGHRPAGFYHDRSRAAYWDGRNDAGEKVASGVYFYELRAGDFSAVRRMVILK